MDRTADSPGESAELFTVQEMSLDEKFFEGECWKGTLEGNFRRERWKRMLEC